MTVHTGEDALRAIRHALRELHAELRGVRSSSGYVNIDGVMSRIAGIHDAIKVEAADDDLLD